MGFQLTWACISMSIFCDVVDTVNAMPREPSLHVVSFARGQLYERVLKQLKSSTARVLPGVQHFLFSEAEFANYITAQHGARRLQELREAEDRFVDAMGAKRPYCAGFKPVMLDLAMRQTPRGDLIAWVDASRYDVAAHVGWPARQIGRDPMFREGMHRGYFGALHCGKEPTNIQMVTPRQFQHFNLSGDRLRRIASWRHVVNSVLILRNDALGRHLVRAWLDVYWKYPRVFCDGVVPDQAIWNLLVAVRDVPVVDFCPCLPPRPKAHQLWKSVVNVFCLVRNRTYRRARLGAFAVEGVGRRRMSCERTWAGSWRLATASPMAELWTYGRQGFPRVPCPRAGSPWLRD